MKGVTVIIVEDELIAAEFLKEMLEKYGLKVLNIVDNGKEAIDVCIEKRPDIIFMDIMLRDNISGSDAAVTISRQIDTKIIFLTAFADQEMVDYAIESHAAGYLTKPYNEMQIIATLRLATEGQGNKKSPKNGEISKNERAQCNTVNLHGGYICRLGDGLLTKNGVEIPLGPRARKLVTILCEKPGISISNEQISMQIWGELVNDRTLRSLIYRIRHLTDDELIKNVSGMGYLIQPLG